MIHKHLRGNLIAYVALFLALGTGAAWAVDRGSVGSREVANKSLRGIDLERGAVKGVHVDEGTLDASQISGPIGVASGIVNRNGSVQVVTSGVKVKRIGSGQYEITAPFSMFPERVAVPIITSVDVPQTLDELIVDGSGDALVAKVGFVGGDRVFTFALLRNSI